MENELIYRILLALLILAFVANRAYYTRKYGQPEEETVRGREQNVASTAAGLLAILAMLSSLAYIVNPAWMAWAALPLPAWLRWFGVALALAGFGLLQWSHLALGRNWSDAPRLLREQSFVNDGPYRRIRHPIYTAFLMILGATLFISANWFIGLAWIGMTSLEVASRMRFEEEIMVERFGDEYIAYMNRTGRLLPRVFAPESSA
jgi:protein-S-isoprenylcysteine O-methyltransferase Ste14